MTQAGSSGTASRVYSNDGNAPLLDMLRATPRTVLDVGCGAGDNAALLRKRYPGVHVVGISGSESEARIARAYMAECLVTDLDEGLPREAQSQSYDAIIFSHVLEHLREPASLVSEAAKHLTEGGVILIAVPNVLWWPQRLKFLTGKFEYESAGIMDDTHLRFLTYRSAGRYLFAKSPNLEIIERRATGSVPLWILRRHLLPTFAASALDAAGTRFFPNLFGAQVLLKAGLKGDGTRAGIPT